MYRLDRPSFAPRPRLVMIVANRAWQFYFLTLVGLVSTYWFAAIFESQTLMAWFSWELWKGVLQVAMLLGCFSWVVSVGESMRDR
jgi:hypothetical protein